MAAKLGDIQYAYVIGDYANSKDTGLIDLALVGQVDNEKLKEIVAKTESLMLRKIRTIVLKNKDLQKLNDRLDIEHAICIWSNGKIIKNG